AMAEQKELAGVGGTEVGSAGGFGKAGDLRSFKMGDVRKGAVFRDAEDASAIAGGSEQALGRPAHGVDNVAAIRPELARRTVRSDFVDFGAVGNDGVSAERMN